MSRYVKLPGQPTKPTTPRDRDVDARRKPVDRETLHRQILAALASGPLATWELRESLHVPEKALSRALHELRAAGQVKQAGRQPRTRKWALPSYQPIVPPQGQIPVYPDAGTTNRSRKPEGSKDSWWTRPTLSREDFQERARRRTDDRHDDEHAESDVVRTP